VVKVEGTVRMRPEDQYRDDWKSGKVEVLVDRYEVLNPSVPLPFQPEDDVKASEEARLRFRPLDLRRPLMQENFRVRHGQTPAGEVLRPSPVPPALQTGPYGGRI